MRHLAQRNVLVPEPIPNHNGEIINALHGKPASIVTKLDGAWEMHPQPVHCAEVGDMLAKMHLAGRDYPLSQPNLRSLDWWNQTTPLVLPYLDSDKQHLLQAEMHFQQAFLGSELYKTLQQGPIHADLFRNNVMFVGEKLPGSLIFILPGSIPGCLMWQ